ncbi:hypothetical protein TrST_g13114 [Triparma strigata]|uniref:PB1 domain-containing protein n=1 Tax=Triparma strigata TaxID=1606541 RepID=A0A9W7F3M6_9STRA|nr:hypothetical protein TrST_g13114 [Triparma strigata]
MDLISSVGGAAEWRSIFSSAMEADDEESETGSLHSMGSTVRSSRRPPPSQIHLPKHMSSRMSNYDRLPSSPGASEISHMARAVEAEFVFKIVDGQGNTHRIKSKSDDIEKLLTSVAGKMGGGVSAESLRLKFTDDEGDVVLISDDAGLKEAVELQRNAGSAALKLSVGVEGGSGGGGVPGGAGGAFGDSNVLIGAAVGGLALCVGIAMVAFRPRR